GGGVVRGGRGAALRVRAGGRVLLPVARYGGGAHRGGAYLVPADPGGNRRDGAHRRLPDRLARGLDLVGADDDPAGADPRLGPLPAALAPGSLTGVNRRRGHGPRPGLRPTPPTASTSAGGSDAEGSGRHLVTETTPGSTSSRPSKKPAISSGERST